MKQFPLFLIVSIFLITACAPVFREEIMKQATLNPSLGELNRDPMLYEGKLYILGGTIVNTKVTKEGSLIEAVYTPVDSRGYLQDYIQSVRFIALYPRNKGILDPLIFAKAREITIAGIYKGVRTATLDEIEYPFSYFEIVEFHLWEIRYPDYYPYPYWWYDPWYDPWYPHHWWR